MRHSRRVRAGKEIAGSPSVFHLQAVRASTGEAAGGEPPHTSSASAIGRSGGNWGRIRRAVLERDNYRCRRCGRAAGADGLEVHHIIPRKLGGGDAMPNLATYCVPCHLILHKTAKNPQRLEWEDYLGV